VTVEVRAAGINPVDYKLFSGTFGPSDATALPLSVGREAAGSSPRWVRTPRPGGPLAVGDEVVVFPANGGYAESITVPAAAVVPSRRTCPGRGLRPAARGATAVHAIAVLGGFGQGDTVLVHGASGSVGQLLVQLAVREGATVIGTAAERNHELVRGLGAIPVAYGPGLEDRVRAAASKPVTAAVDTVGTEEAIDVSLAVLADPDRLVTIASPRPGVRRIGGGPGADPGTEIRSNAWRTLLPLAAAGDLKLPVTRTYPLAEAADAVRFVKRVTRRARSCCCPRAEHSSDHKADLGIDLGLVRGTKRPGLFGS